MRCQAITRSGERCRKSALKDSRFCFHHNRGIEFLPPQELKPDVIHALDRVIAIESAFLGRSEGYADELRAGVGDLKSHWQTLKAKLKEGTAWSESDMNAFLYDLSITEGMVQFMDYKGIVSQVPELLGCFDRVRGWADHVLWENEKLNLKASDLGVFLRDHIDGITPAIYFPSLVPPDEFLKSAALYLDKVFVYQPCPDVIRRASDVVGYDSGELIESLERFRFETAILVEEGVLEIYQPRFVPERSDLWQILPILPTVDAGVDTEGQLSLFLGILEMTEVFGVVPITDSQELYQQLVKHSTAQPELSLGSELISENLPLPQLSYDDVLEMRRRIRDEAVAFKEELTTLAAETANATGGLEVLQKRANKALKELKEKAEESSRKFLIDTAELVGVALAAAYVKGLSVMNPIVSVPLAISLAFKYKRFRDEGRKLGNLPLSFLSKLKR